MAKALSVLSMSWGLSHARISGQRTLTISLLRHEKFAMKANLKMAAVKTQSRSR